MAKTKRKKLDRGKKKKSSNKISETRQADLTVSMRRETAFTYVLNGLLLIYLLYYLFQLYASLDNTFFWADENKHAYICSLVYKTHHIPTVLPDDLYGDYRWSYPPLFHILGAAFMGIAGPASLKFFNLILLVIFLPSFYYLIRKHYGDNVAAVACLLITFSPVLAVNTIRLTTEMLSMSCIFFSFFFSMVAIKKTDKFHAAVAGLFTGMLMLSKQAGFVVLGFYVLLLCWFFWKDQKSLKVLLIVIGVAVCTYSPYLIWAIYNKVEVLGFVSAFLGLTEKPEWSAMALKSFHKYNSGLMEFIHLFYKGNQWVITVSLFLPFYHFIRRRLKDEPQNYFFILLIYLALVMMVWHITNKRHTIILLPLIAFLVGYSINQIVTNKLLIKVPIMLLLFFAGYTTFHMPNYRQQSNGPEEFINIVEIVKEDKSSDFRLLCLRKFDAIMYAQKPVIWPHPKLRKIPIDLVEKQSAENLFTVLKKYRIKYILIEVPLITRSDEFYSGKYPLYFVRACERLEQQGKIAFVAMAKSRRYILLKVVS